MTITAVCARLGRLLPTGAVVLAAAVAGGLATGAGAEQASAPATPAAGGLDAGGFHSCAVLSAGSVRCWGFGADGELGYGNTATIGDDETPASAGPVNLGGRTVTGIATGDAHTCAVLDDRTVRCWGFGGDGRLGYGNTTSIGDNETPDAAGPVDVGGPARAITAGASHTCAVLVVDGSVRCWGFGGFGRLGYTGTSNVGDNETPASAGAVNLGGLRAVAISAGGLHTCAVLEDGSVRCWGFNLYGQLGGGTAMTTMATVTLGGLRAVAVSAGAEHSCAVLEDGSVRCWGFGDDGQLGYGNIQNVRDPSAAGPVNLGGLKAVAVSAGGGHTCVILQDGSVRCWGYGGNGRLGYASEQTLGTTPATTPDKIGPVYLGPGRTAVAISAGNLHTCARLDDGRVRCWGYGDSGRPGYCNTTTIGDDETPGSAGPVNLEPGDGGAACPSAPSPPPPPAGVSSPTALPQRPAGALAGDGLVAQRVRAAGLRRCRQSVARRARTQRLAARRLAPGARTRTLRRITRSAARGRGRCLSRYARTPARVNTLTARATSPTTIVLRFTAVSTDNPRPPAARAYIITQTQTPNPTPRRPAQRLCGGTCRFPVATIGAPLTLTITRLRPNTTYHYTVTARDNVTARPGPRSAPTTTRTRP